MNNNKTPLFVNFPDAVRSCWDVAGVLVKKYFWCRCDFAWDDALGDNSAGNGYPGSLSIVASIVCL